MAKQTAVEQSPQQPLLLMTARDGLRIVVAGIIIGLVTIALYYVLEKYVFTPILCGEGTNLSGRCESKDLFASALATIIGAMGGLFAMVNQRVFRPLLVVLLVTVGLWNLPLLLVSLPWWGVVLGAGVAFGLAYAAFAWLVQLRNLFLAAGISVLIVVVMRLIIAG